MRIAILGPGRLGRSLALLLGRAGHDVRLYGREGLPRQPFDVVLLTVPDAVLPQLAASLPDQTVVLHCSGAASVDVLRPHAPAGSLHPLMTFPGPEVALPDLRGVPAAVDGDDEAVAIARSLCADLGLEPITVPGDRRLYHAAAVISGNFGTLLLAEASRVLTAAGLPAERAGHLLLPLALASLRNAADDPARALTGPAARGDEPTIEGHRRALQEAGLEDVGALYEVLTQRVRTRVRPR